MPAARALHLLRIGDLDIPAEQLERVVDVASPVHQLLTTELAVLDRDLDRLVTGAAPALCALKGVGTDVAGALLVAAGDNPERLRSEGAFANLGVAP